MASNRADDLEEALLRAGVSPRHVRRARLELQTHVDELTEEGARRGADYDAARADALIRIGSNENLVRSYASRSELQSWSHRHPIIWYAALPMLAYFALGALCMALFVLVAQEMTPYLRRVTVAPEVSRNIEIAVRIIVLGLLPLLVALFFAIAAYRGRVRHGWPIAGIVATSILASLINITVLLRSGETPGAVGAGIGVSVDSLPGQMIHALLICLLALVPLRFAMRRIQRGRDR